MRAVRVVRVVRVGGSGGVGGQLSVSSFRPMLATKQASNRLLNRLTDFSQAIARSSFPVQHTPPPRFFVGTEMIKTDDDRLVSSSETITTVTETSAKPMPNNNLTSKQVVVDGCQAMAVGND